MTIVQFAKTNVVIRDLTNQEQNKTRDISFVDFLSSHNKTKTTITDNCFSGSERFDIFRARVIEQRPSCLICGMTISSEGTCMCEYPTVINNHSGVSLNYNKSAQTECSDISDITDGNQDMQNFNNNVILRDANKIKLRHRCLKCGTVSDDGSCMCDALNDDDKAENVQNIQDT